MTDRPAALKQYPRPDKRNKPDIQLSDSKRILAKGKSQVIDGFINSQVAQVSKSNIERWINSITSFQLRSKNYSTYQIPKTQIQPKSSLDISTTSIAKMKSA